MVCPYAVNRHTVTQTAYEYDEDGTVKMCQTIDHNTAEFVKCKKEECGAWRDGRCHYGNNNQ